MFEKAKDPRLSKKARLYVPGQVRVWDNSILGRRERWVWVVQCR